MKGIPGATDNPALAQRLLRQELRQRREQVGLTQQQVAAALDWSTSKLLRFENGQTRLSVTDVRALLGCYQITAADLVERYVALGRAATQRGWWTPYRKALGPAVTTYFALETSAARVRQFHCAVVPELLQTPDYADAVDHLRVHQQPELIAASRAARPLRQALVAAADGPDFTFIIEDHVLWRRIGGLRTLDHQLAVLAARMERGLDLRIAPLARLGSVLTGSSSLTVFDHDGHQPSVFKLDPQLDPLPFTGDGSTASAEVMDAISPATSPAPADTRHSLDYIHQVRQSLQAGIHYTPMTTQHER